MQKIFNTISIFLDFYKTTMATSSDDSYEEYTEDDYLELVEEMVYEQEKDNDEDPYENGYDPDEEYRKKASGHIKYSSKQQFHLANFEYLEKKYQDKQDEEQFLQKNKMSRRRNRFYKRMEMKERNTYFLYLKRVEIDKIVAEKYKGTIFESRPIGCHRGGEWEHLYKSLQQENKYEPHQYLYYEADTRTGLGTWTPRKHTQFGVGAKTKLYNLILGIRRLRKDPENPLCYIDPMVLEEAFTMFRNVDFKVRY